MSRTSGQNTVWIQENRTGIKTLNRTVSKLNIDVDTMVDQQTALNTKVDGRTKEDEVETKVDRVETKVDRVKNDITVLGTLIKDIRRDLDGLKAT